MLNSYALIKIGNKSGFQRITKNDSYRFFKKLLHQFH